MTFQYGDTVKIRREALRGDLQSFPQGYFIRYIDKDRVEVELAFWEEKVKLNLADIELIRKVQKSI